MENNEQSSLKNNEKGNHLGYYVLTRHDIKTDGGGNGNGKKKKVIEKHDIVLPPPISSVIPSNPITRVTNPGKPEMIPEIDQCMRCIIDNYINVAKIQSIVNPVIMAFIVFNGVYEQVLDYRRYEISDEYTECLKHKVINDDQLLVDMSGNNMEGFLYVKSILVYVRKVKRLHTVIHRQTLKQGFFSRLANSSTQQDFYYKIYVDFSQ